MIKNIIFDFDGVLCESVDIKTQAFYEMYQSYGENIAQQVRRHHIQNGGMSRFDKFKYYEEEFLSHKLNDLELKQLSLIFSNLVKEKIIAAPFVNGALEFLEHYAKNYKCFIVSATPMNEMLEIAKNKKIEHYFLGIYGSPTTKPEWCKKIIETFSLIPRETLFIGDAMSDYKAAMISQFHFLLRLTLENRDLITKIDSATINDLTEIPYYLKQDWIKR